MKLFQIGRDVNVFWQNDKYSIPEITQRVHGLRDFPTCPMQPWLVSLCTTVFTVSREMCFWARIASLPAIRLILSNGELAKAQMGTLHSITKIPKAWYKYILLEKSEERLVLTSRSRRISTSERSTVSIGVWVAIGEPDMNSWWHRLSHREGGVTSAQWPLRAMDWDVTACRNCWPKNPTFPKRREEKRSWTSVTMSSSPEASSHRALYLLLCMLTSQQRSISFTSRAQWLRTPLWVNNIPKYQSCDWIQPPGKSVGFKEITAASTQDNRPGLFYWVQL